MGKAFFSMSCFSVWIGKLRPGKKHVIDDADAPQTPKVGEKARIGADDELLDGFNADEIWKNTESENLTRLPSLPPDTSSPPNHPLQVAHDDIDLDAFAEHLEETEPGIPMGAGEDATEFMLPNGSTYLEPNSNMRGKRIPGQPRSEEAWRGIGKGKGAKGIRRKVPDESRESEEVEEPEQSKESEEPEESEGYIPTSDDEKTEKKRGRGNQNRGRNRSRSRGGGGFDTVQTTIKPGGGGKLAIRNPAPEAKPKKSGQSSRRPPPPPKGINHIDFEEQEYMLSGDVLDEFDTIRGAWRDEMPKNFRNDKWSGHHGGRQLKELPKRCANCDQPYQLNETGIAMRGGPRRIGQLCNSCGLVYGKGRLFARNADGTTTLYMPQNYRQPKKTSYRFSEKQEDYKKFLIEKLHIPQEYFVDAPTGGKKAKKDPKKPDHKKGSPAPKDSEDE